MNKHISDNARENWSLTNEDSSHIFRSFIEENDPYSSYKKICTKLLEDYGKCILEKTAKYSGSKAEGIRENSRLTIELVLDRSSSEFSQNTHACNDQLYLIQKWCMNPVGVVGYNINTNS